VLYLIVSMTEANFADIPREVYYDDGFVTLDRRGITIRGYYWPLCLSTAIPYSDIVQFGTTDDLDVSCCAYSNWGTSGAWARRRIARAHIRAQGSGSAMYGGRLGAAASCAAALAASL